MLSEVQLKILALPLFQLGLNDVFWFVSSLDQEAQIGHFVVNRSKNGDLETGERTRLVLFNQTQEPFSSQVTNCSWSVPNCLQYPPFKEDYWHVCSSTVLCNSKHFDLFIWRMENLSSQDERIDQVAGVFQRALRQRCRSQQKIPRHVFPNSILNIDPHSRKVVHAARQIENCGKRKETTFINTNEK